MYSSAYNCIFWAVGAKFSLFFSMFIVVMVSVTRTVAVAAPYHRPRTWVVVKVCLGYAVAMLLIDAVVIGLQYWNVIYNWRVTGCTFMFNPAAPIWSRDVYKNVLMLELLVPSLTVLISFIVSIVYIVKQRNRHPEQNTEKFKQASVTISIFTAVFLLCNLPFFGIHLLNNVIVWFDIGFTLQDSPFVDQYGWLLSHAVLPILNATINPCLYLTRLSHFRRWMCIGLKYITESIVSSRGT